MAAQGILVPPSEPTRTQEQAELWESTFSRIDTFLPNLQQELFQSSSRSGRRLPVNQLVDFPTFRDAPSPPPSSTAAAPVQEAEKASLQKPVSPHVRQDSASTRATEARALS